MKRPLSALPGDLFFILLGLIAILAASVGSANAQSLETVAPNAILIDASTDTVLLEKNADTPFPPASMSKMMTVYQAFRMISQNIVSLSDVTEVQEETWRRWRLQGSTMYLNAGDEVTIADLLRGVIVQSGNDASVVLAEALAGSEDAFVELMNQTASDIGLTGSHFVNTTGWPADDHYVTARDLAVIADRTVKDFPELYELYGEQTFAYGPPANHHNRNPILGRVEGADGLKTGHTQEAGYGLTGSAIRDGRRIIMVVAGLDSEAQRARESQRLIEYAFRVFKTYDLFAAGDVVDEANVWLGDTATVPLVVADDVRLTLSRPDRNRMTVKVVYDAPIPAPIAEGQPVGTVRIEIADSEPRIIPLYAESAVDEIGGFGKIGAAFRYLLLGATPSD